jgi:hypothetical protein
MSEQRDSNPIPGRSGGVTSPSTIVAPPENPPNGWKRKSEPCTLLCADSLVRDDGNNGGIERWRRADLRSVPRGRYRPVQDLQDLNGALRSSALIFEFSGPALALYNSKRAAARKIGSVQIAARAVPCLLAC